MGCPVLARVKITVSASSTSPSSVTTTSTVADCASAGIIAVPLKAVKSVPEVAVPATV